MRILKPDDDDDDDELETLKGGFEWRFRQTFGRASLVASSLDLDCDE